MDEQKKNTFTACYVFAHKHAHIYYENDVRIKRDNTVITFGRFRYCARIHDYALDDRNVNIQKSSLS